MHKRTQKVVGFRTYLQLFGGNLIGLISWLLLKWKTSWNWLRKPVNKRDDKCFLLILQHTFYLCLLTCLLACSVDCLLACLFAWSFAWLLHAVFIIFYSHSFMCHSSFSRQQQTRGLHLVSRRPQKMKKKR